MNLSNCLEPSLNDKWLITPALFSFLKIRSSPLRPSHLFWLQGFFQDFSVDINWVSSGNMSELSQTDLPLSFGTFLFGWDCCLQWFCLPANNNLSFFHILTLYSKLSNLNHVIGFRGFLTEGPSYTAQKSGGFSSVADGTWVNSPLQLDGLKPAEGDAGIHTLQSSRIV